MGLIVALSLILYSAAKFNSPYLVEYVVGKTLIQKAPPGTDPKLWSVLTAEERAFFARARSMGQITYGPGTRNSQPGVPRGGRLDVRV